MGSNPIRSMGYSLSSKTMIFKIVDIGASPVTLKKFCSLIGKTLYCEYKIKGSNPFRIIKSSLIGKTLYCEYKIKGSNPFFYLYVVE